ncbi:MAG: lysophospholipid acyltransferase family protein [Nanoarchaeota archaeon]|nr:lysophospholipid acyltransferase family protein [Nanoarchaeota archaeon]
MFTHFVKYVLTPAVRLYLRSVEGAERLPQPPFIVAANHASYLDDVMVPAMLMTLANTDMHIYVNSRYYKNPLLRRFLLHYHCIPVDVAKDVQDQERRRKTNERAFTEALEALKKGKLFGLFPEGARSADGKLQKAKTGVARIAIASQVPVVPVGVIGSYEVWPKGKALPRFKRAELKIGQPLTFKRFAGKENDPSALEAVTRTIMKEIAKLTRQVYDG